ncbi:MAG: GYD domain-containing protein [Candidatus Korobacteraceae bacterium]
MPYFLHQIAYTSEGWAALAKKPQNRVEAVRPAFEKLGGKIESAFFSFGEYDIVIISQFPDQIAAAAMAVAVGAGGACKSVVTTPLLTAEEAVQAMKKAGATGYRPAKK